MPDRRRNRGANQADPQLFAPEAIPSLRSAVADLSWLLERGYADPSALKLVGDRHGLARRQREAVRRSACSDAMRELHGRHRIALEPGALAGRAVLVDGFNCIVTVESALGGGVVLRCRDGWHRDVASVHGSYRKVAQTERAAELLGEALERAGANAATWLLDRPVSNSGRLRALLLDVARRRGWDWTVELPDDPDLVLKLGEAVAATSDGGVLDHGLPCCDLAGAAIAAGAPQAWIVDLGGA